MANIFELVVQKMIEFGFYNFVFPFILTSALMYALLKRSKILGESIVINSLVSLSIAFLVFGFPVIVGVSFEMSMSTFFTQATVWVLVLVVGVVMASVFYPDLMKALGETFTKRTTIYEMLALAVVLMVTSGLVGVFTQTITPAPGKSAIPTPPRDILIVISAIVIFIVLILISAAIFKTGV